MHKSAATSINLVDCFIVPKLLVSGHLVSLFVCYLVFKMVASVALALHFTMFHTHTDAG